MATRQQVDAAVFAAGQATQAGDAADVIATMGQHYRELRSLINRVLTAGVGWELAGDLQGDVEMVLAEHDR